MHCARCSCPSEQVTFMIFIQYFGTELQLKAYQKLMERDPCRMSPADSRNLTCMLHKPLDCLLRASPPGHRYLQRDRTRTAPPRNPRQRRPGDAPLPAARRAGDCAHCAAGQPGGSAPGGGRRPRSGTGGGERRLRAGDRRSAGPGSSTAAAGPCSRNDRASSAAPFLSTPSVPGSRHPRPPSPAPAEPAGPARPAQWH